MLIFRLKWNWVTFALNHFLFILLKTFYLGEKYSPQICFFNFFFYRIRNLLNIILRVSGTQIFSLSHAHDKLIISFFHKINYLGKFPKTVKSKMLKKAIYGSLRSEI